MVANKVLILQLGDFHFPNAMSAPITLDHKDTGVSGALGNQLACSPIQAVFRKLQSLLDTLAIDCIAIMGDLTNLGNMDAYEQCLNFLSQALIERPNNNYDKHKVIILPGNHDVVRPKSPTDPADKRFEQVRELLAKKGYNFIAPDKLSVNQIGSEPSCGLVLGLNTCLGCGELRGVPKSVKSAVEEHYRSVLASGAGGPDQDEALQDLYESIDSPAIAQTVIHKVAEETRNKNVLAICGHHNILPQSVPRIAPYAEMLNSGNFRDALLQTKKHVLYLHGHIHDGPIELIGTPYSEKAQIISISAPELTSGFNLIEIEFDALGNPLGCCVHLYRHNNGQVPEAEKIGG